MKRLLFFICTLLCANVLFAQSFSEGDLLYRVTGAGEVKVYDCSYSATSVNIPSLVTHAWKHREWSDYDDDYIMITDSIITYSVTSIGDWAFYGCSSLTSVTIGNSVTSIGDSAFYGCSSLDSVTIPNSVTSIGNHAFYGCSSLTSVTIPNSVTSIGGAAFYGCSSLTSVTLSNNITELPCYYGIGYYDGNYGFFEGCSSLTSVTIPNSVTSIGIDAFVSCSSLTSVTIGNSVTSIGDEAFYGCSGLTSVTIPNSVTYIGKEAFRGCNSLTSVTIGNSVTSIGVWAFRNCSSLTTLNYNAINCNDFEYYNNSVYGDYYRHQFRNCPITTINIGDSVQRIPNDFAYNLDSLTSVTIGNSVTSIGENAFRGCNSLTSVTIPNSVTSIGENAFRNCSSLTTLNYNAINCNDFSYVNFVDDYYHQFAYCPITTINIGDSVQRIPNYFAYKLDSLTSVNIGNSVTSIGKGAFDYCYSLTYVTIPNSVTSIGEYAFAVCSSLTSITIPNSVTSIEGSTFSGCSSLTSVTIGNSVTSIGNHAFNSCSSLTSVNIGNSVTSIGEDAFRNCNSLTSVTIGNSVDTIGSQAFYNCSSLTTLNFNAINCEDFATGYSFQFYDCPISTINIGDSVQRIPNNFAYNLDSLTSVTIGNSVDTIGDYAFAYCYRLTSVNIGNSVTSIGNSAFNSCSSLTSVNIPNSVTSIGNSAFYNCSSLIFITIGNSVTSIGNSAFRGCSSLISVTIPNSVTSIGNWAFSGCSTFESVTIPNSVTFIGKWAFSGCSSLDFVTIPNSVTSIGDSMFYGCSRLMYVTCLANIPPALGNNVFYNTPHNKILYVNCGLINDYISSWTCFYSNNIHEITFDINTYVNNESRGSVAIERNNCSTATLTATANICYQFVRWNDGNTENPRVVSLSSDTSFTAIFDSILFDTTINATINAGETYTENGFNVNEEGTYTQTLQTINGCDSIVTLTLNIIPVFNTELTVNICEGQVYAENGFNVSEAGVYTQILTASNGFDSIVTLSLNVNPVFDTTINATINAGETYAEFGFNESEAGTYVQNLQTINGCDSTITLILDVNSSLMDVVDTELSFYPNPTDSKITFSSTIERIEVIDLTGRCVLTFSNAREINIESLPSGAYYLRLTNNDKAIMRKVIKE